MNVSSIGGGGDAWSPALSAPKPGPDPAALALVSMQGLDEAVAQSMGRIASGTVDTYA